MRAVAWAMSLAAVTTVAARQLDPPTLSDVLNRAGERVERYFARAQSIVCLEVVRLHPLTSGGWTSEDIGRTVESELRLSWEPEADGGPAGEAQMLRRVVRVNGRKPRAHDGNDCTTPEQQTHEPQPLSLLLPDRRGEYEFKLAGRANVDGHEAITVDYRLTRKVTVESRMVEGRDDCVSFDIEGGMRGRLWIDAETYDVLRLDQRLGGMVDIPLPRRAVLRSNGPTSWTMERWDMSIRFKRVAFTNPDEILVLPSSVSSLQITRGAGTPRLRTITEYKSYQRFLTAGRIVKE